LLLTPCNSKVGVEIIDFCFINWFLALNHAVFTTWLIYLAFVLPFEINIALFEGLVPAFIVFCFIIFVAYYAGFN
jgi:hypothetical protein